MLTNAVKIVSTFKILYFLYVVTFAFFKSAFTKYFNPYTKIVLLINKKINKYIYLVKKFAISNGIYMFH